VLAKKDKDEWFCRAPTRSGAISGRRLAPLAVYVEDTKCSNVCLFLQS
jgi:hypothetical protein